MKRRNPRLEERRWTISEARCTKCSLHFICKHLSSSENLWCPRCEKACARKTVLS